MTARGKVLLATAGAAVVALGAAVAVPLLPSAPNLGMTVDEVRTEWPPTLGADVPAFVTLTNRGPRPVRLLGNEYMSCGTNVCYGAKPFPPATLAPGESAVVEYTLMPRGVGPYSASTDLFVHRDGRIERVTVRFTGDILPGRQPPEPVGH